jgi:nicotinate-nucleotide pyrophosphorylase (carboxylating)
LKPEPGEIARQVAATLAEDIGPGDVSAVLIDPDTWARAQLITRQAGILAGRDWAEMSFLQLDPACRLNWQAEDGALLAAGQLIVEIEGPARALLSAERTALNFLQLLSGVATRTRAFVDAVAGTGCRILDTRKTLPGLRLAQKYAVTAGGGHNHRLGLHDMVMLKENHIAAAGGIGPAVARARQLHPGLVVEVETENLDQLDQALAAGAERIMLDNYALEDMRTAVTRTAGRATLEASGGINLDTLRAIAETGVDEISVGELTKAIAPLDLSMRMEAVRGER